MEQRRSETMKMRCKVDIGNDTDLEMPERVPVIYRDRKRSYREIIYAKLERIGSEIWASFEAEEGGEPAQNDIKVTASVVDASALPHADQLLAQRWITAIIVKCSGNLWTHLRRLRFT
jgi:hypothetical protein